MIRTIAATVAVLVALSAASYAADAPRPVLKSDALVTGSIVRVGDLIDNAGIIANVAIFRAPDLGLTGVVPADAVVEAVRTHGLVGLDTNGISEVVVTRASREIPVGDVAAIVARALSTRFNLGDAKEITVTFERDPSAIQVEPNAKGEPRVARIAFDPRSGKFDAALEIPTGANGFSTLRLNGKAAVTGDVVMLSHTVERGALIKDTDVIVGPGRVVISTGSPRLAANLPPAQTQTSADTKQ